jgi:hypothetical protein
MIANTTSNVDPIRPGNRVHFQAAERWLRSSHPETGRRLVQQVLSEAKDRSGKLVFRNDPVTIAGKDRPTLLAWKGTEDFEVLRGMIESLAASFREDPGVEEVQM